MKIYLSHTTKYDFQNELYALLKQSKLHKLHEINYFLDDDHPTRVKNSQEVIKVTNLVIADISIQSTAIGIELGWANAYNVPIILIYKAGTPVSKYMSTVSDRIIEYKDSTDLITKLEEIV
jgi:hypothetical protein